VELLKPPVLTGLIFECSPFTGIECMAYPILIPGYIDCVTIVGFLESYHISSGVLPGRFELACSFPFEALCSILKFIIF